LVAHAQDAAAQLATAGAISVGADLGCAIMPGRPVQCWNRLDMYHLPETLDNGRIGVLPGDPGLVSVVASGTAVCGLDSAGAAFCWGFGPARWAPFTPEARAVPCGGNRCAEQLVPIAAGLHFRRLSPPLKTMCGVTTAGRVYCWGDNSTGAVGRAAPRGGTNRPTAIALPAALRFVAVDVSPGYQACAVSDGGELWCWGAGRLARQGPPGVHFTSVGLGYAHGCALADDGVPWCWGHINSFSGPNPFNGALGAVDSLRPGADSTGCEGRCLSRPTPVGDGHRFGTLSVGYSQVCGHTANGAAVWCWGDNGSGILGSGQRAAQLPHSAVPVRVAGERRFVAVSTGFQRACALTAAAEVYCWGSWGIGYAAPELFGTLAR